MADRCEVWPLLRYRADQPEECPHRATTTVRTLYGQRPACDEHARQYADTSGIEQDEEPDREPSAEQERAWNEQYDGTSFGA